MTAPVDASAEVSLRVPRGESGDLESGVAAVIEGVDGVTAVAVDRVMGVRPTFTDVRVEADVTVSVAVPDDADGKAAVTERLADGFGVMAVDELTVEG